MKLKGGIHEDKEFFEVPIEYQKWLLHKMIKGEYVQEWMPYDASWLKVLADEDVVIPDYMKSNKAYRIHVVVEEILRCYEHKIGNPLSNFFRFGAWGDAEHNMSCNKNSYKKLCRLRNELKELNYIPEPGSNIEYLMSLNLEPYLK